MFRKRKRPTPGFKIPPPFNPTQGENANLRQDGTAPFCAMMQVAAEDTYDEYVICRGFDPRILRFIDYAEGDPNRPGISVAKPFGKRTAGMYQIAEIYPAFLPTQGNAEFSGFKQVVYIPPSPANVNWRVGQNPGVVAGGGLGGGQPSNLTDAIEVLYDHNGKVINWMIVDTVSSSSSGEKLFRFQSLEAMVTNSCSATIRRMNRTNLSIQIIYDPDGIFQGMQAGTYGRAYLQGGKYYVIQAKCDPDIIDFTDYEAE